MIRIFLLSSLITVSAFGAEIESFPAGVRLSFSIKPSIKFSLNALAPSLLWISASSPELRTVKISTREENIIVDDITNSMECAVPIYASGPVDVEIITTGKSGSSPVIVTSFYGVGEIVDTFIPPLASVQRAVIAESEPIKNILETSSVKNVQSIILEEQKNISVNSNTVELKPEINHSEVFLRLFAGDWHTGKFDSIADVKTFRVYIPNRSAFTVKAAGDCGIRIQSEKGELDKTIERSGELKTIFVSSPSDGYYLISLKGEGSFGIEVEVER